MLVLLPLQDDSRGLATSAGPRAWGEAGGRGGGEEDQGHGLDAPLTRFLCAAHGLHKADEACFS